MSKIKGVKKLVNNLLNKDYSVHDNKVLQFDKENVQKREEYLDNFLSTNYQKNKKMLFIVYLKIFQIYLIYFLIYFYNHYYDKIK